jgi:sigma-E factor negative regulatory protein RseC
MTESEAIVTRVDGQHVWLDVARASSCGSCERAGSCGTDSRRETQRRRVPNTVGARVGDTVVLGVPDGAVLKAVLWSYLVPLVLTIVGAASGLALGGEGGAVIGAVAGLAAGGFILGFAGRRLERARQPLLVMRLKPAIVQLQRKPHP